MKKEETKVSGTKTIKERYSYNVKEFLTEFLKIY